MRDKLEQQLMDKFPFMEARSVFSGEKLGFPFGCECGDGWYDIIYKLCDELNSLYIQNGKDLNEILVQQVKEKYGSLRFYTGGLIEGGHDIISKYEDLSAETCEICGKEGKLTGAGWVQTLCDDCLKR